MSYGERIVLQVKMQWFTLNAVSKPGATLTKWVLIYEGRNIITYYWCTKLVTCYSLSVGCTTWCEGDNVFGVNESGVVHSIWASVSYASMCVNWSSWCRVRGTTSAFPGPFVCGMITHYNAIDVTKWKNCNATEGARRAVRMAVPDARSLSDWISFKLACLDVVVVLVLTINYPISMRTYCPFPFHHRRRRVLVAAKLE